MTIGIIGGGIAGIAAAISLSKAGHAIDLYEKTDEFKEVGAGLQIGPNAVSALKQLGVFDALEPLTVAPKNIRIMDGISGKLLSTLPLGSVFENRFGQPYRVAHRADLLTALVETASGHSNIKFHLGKSLTQLDIQPDNNICQFSDGLQSKHQTLIGADGFRSVVRRHVINDGPPVFAGHSLYRTLVPEGQWPDISHIQDVHLWLYPGGHVVHYPVSAGKNLNIVAASEQDWESKSWSTPAEPNDVLSYFPKAANNLLKILNSPDQWLKWAAAGHPHSQTWHKYQTFLIGDAIHPTLPYMAQGAAMALEDAVCLAAAAKTGNISQFIPARQDRTKKIVAHSTKLGKIYHMSNPKRLARNFVIQKMSLKAQYNNLAWVYDWSAPKL